MKIKRIVLNGKLVKYEVYGTTNGRNSPRVRRRFDSRGEAEEFAHEFQTQVKAKKRNPNATGRFEDTTFQIEAAYWLENAKIRFKPSHILRAEGILNELLPALGHLSPDKIGPGLLSSLQRQIKGTQFLKSQKCRNKVEWSDFKDDGTKRRRRKKKPSLEVPKFPSNATVNRKIEIVTTVLNYSAKQKRIPFNPCANFQKLPDDSVEKEFWERTEAESFLSFANKKYPAGSKLRWRYVAYLTALNCALRAGEIWGLQPRDISADTLLIRRQYERTTRGFAFLKSKDGRDSLRRTPCNADLRKELLLLVTLSNIQPDETVFMTDDRKPICHDNFRQRIFEKDMKEWGGRRIRFHDLRHTSITLLIASGFDIKTVQTICGHRNISTTMRYVHMLGGMVSEVARTFSIAPKFPEQRKLTIVSSEGV